MRVVIAGSRGFNDYYFLQKKLDELLPPSAVIISGGARGADTLAERYAKERGLWFEKVPAEWRKNVPEGREYNPAAGMIRNKEMAKRADWLIAFNAGTPGTTNMICEMKKLGKKVVEIRVEI